MRSVVLGLEISLDGYIARPNGSVDFLLMPKGYSLTPFALNRQTKSKMTSATPARILDLVLMVLI